MFTYLAPWKTAWTDLDKAYLTDKRRFCSEKCMRESLPVERKKRLGLRALEAAKCMCRLGLDSSTAETVWRMAAPKFYVHISKRTDCNPSYGPVVYHLRIEYF
jgi:hypothetical protein